MTDRIHLGEHNEKKCSETHFYTHICCYICFYRWPQCNQIGTDSLVVEWQAPAWDGGSAITNYIIEKQELPMTAWTRAGHTRFNLFPVTDLTPGNEYKFRVFAENVHGRSDPSDESSAVETKGVMKKKQPKTKYESQYKSTSLFDPLEH